MLVAATEPPTYAVPTGPPPSHPPPSVSPVEQPEPDGRRRGVAGLAVLLCLALAAAAIGVVGAMLLFDGRDDAAGDTTAGDVAGSSDAAPAVQTEDVEASPVVTASTEPKEQRFRCWDRTRAVTRAGCKADPEGLEGIYWLFPQAQGQACTQSQQPGRDVFLTCTTGSSSGTKVTVNYTAWTTWDQAWSHYSGLDIQSALKWPGMHGWYVEARGDDADYKAALLYRDVPFSVTVYGASADDRQAALDQLVVRPVTELRGERIR